MKRLTQLAMLALTILPVAASAAAPAEADAPSATFEGAKSAWHGFDRYDFLMDEETLTIKPVVNKGSNGVKGQRQCIVVVPKAAASGNPWSWQGCYWDHEPQAEVELLKRGFHIAFVAPDADGQGKVWDAWYKFLTEQHGLAKKAAFVGMSKGGVNEFNWGVVNPDKVACIYADNTALYDEDFAKVPELAKHDIPLLHICGSEDFLLQRHTRVVEDTYHQLGGLITVIVKEGHAHHPHSLQNAKPIADWIEQHMTPSTANRPAFVDAKFAKGYYYSLEPSFIYLKEENTYATARGPGFTECYDRYDGPTSGKFRMGGMSIIVPKTVAPGKPWVFTGDPIERDATVEQAMLAKGYHILIVSPLGSGMTQKQWNDAYQLLVDDGFSNKPALKGTGPKAGEAYAWAIANPEKVSCIYARNPLMHSLMAGKQQPIDNLAALAKAGVPVLHDCGALDPWLDNQTRVVEKRYKELDGKITVIVRAGEGHFPLSPNDSKSVVDFIVGVGLKSAPSDDKAAPQNDLPQKDPAASGKPTFDKNSPFYFDGAISRQALENYLDHAITMGYFLVPGRPEGYQFPYRDDDVRMIHNIGAKFIGRAIYRWGEESKLGDPAFLEYAKKMVDRVHAADPEVVFQGCLFEQVSTDVNKLKIPAWVFTDFGLPVEDRTFSNAAIIKREGRPARAGGRGGVPIINNLETRLWFYFLAASYINVGCEALHLGQVGLIGADDKDLKVYSEFLAKVRTYAKLHARRHLVLMDGHVPSGGMVKDGLSLLDFNSFPMRIEAVPGKPQEAILEIGHLDAIFKRSKGCISPSGWKCEGLPYLVEFDNFGRGPNPNVADPKSMFCWGWDEISWFAQQPQEYRNQWLLYANNWIKRTDPNGHLQMPGTRMLSCPNETLRTYFANTKSPACPVGYSQEETIKEIWSKNTWIPVKGDAPTLLYRDGAAAPDDSVKKQAGNNTVAARSDPPASPEVTAAMQPYLDHYKLAGVIGIIADRNGKVHYRNLLGFADVEAKKPISEDNTFWIASMTKMFAGASIMMLVDEGKVSLDDPVTKFIPQLSKWMVVEEKDQSHVLLKPPVRPVTIRHVLSHTSGLAGSSELQQVTGSDSTPLKARALSSVTGPLQWQPGDKYAYGNQGMNIAARIVEIVAGMPYEEFLQKRFFDPLGMTETSFWPSEAQIARLAGAYGPNRDNSGYARDKIGFLTKPLSDRVHRFPEAGGGLFSTTHDIFRYGLLLANDGELNGKRYLSHAAMDELRKEQTGKTKVNYSLGYHLRNGMFGHDGAYGTDLSVDPKTGLVAIFMVQSTNGDRWVARDLFLKTATQVFPK